jgi:hypothetical protein
MKSHLIPFAHVLLYGLCFSAGIAPLTSRASAQTLPSRIEIVVVEGNGVINEALRPVAHNLSVRVEDDDHKPVAGASVVFALPVTGPTGAFVNGATNLTIVTDASGMAVAHGLRTNQNPGKLEIYVTASYRGLRAKGLITQSIEGAPGAPARKPQVRSHSGGKWKWVVLGVVAAGGAGGGIYYHNSRQSSSNSAISISTGSVVFGSPR